MFKVMKRLGALCLGLLIVAIGGKSFSADFFKDDVPTSEAKYLKRVEQDRIKEKYGRKIMDRTPSGYMTVDEYEELSMPTDKSIIDYGTPKVETPNDRQYVPHPTYKVVRYNDPPGSAELSIGRNLYQTRQLNLPGIAAPDFTFMVYPAIYYYPQNAATTCDLFMVPLRGNDTNVNKILKANIANRFPEPIMSTDKELTNSSAFRTLTPIDFSEDGSKLLVKEKIGSSRDGIWETRVLVYDFTQKTTYDLVEIREAVAYYWKEYRGLDLADKRWDIYPLGFSKANPERIVVSSYAYTGDSPVFLGLWSVDTKGERARLVSMNNTSVDISANGFKLARDGIEPFLMVEKQQKDEKTFAKKEEKKAKEADKKVVREYNSQMNAELKEVNKQYKYEKQDYELSKKLQGTTTMNENAEKYQELQEKLNIQRQLKEQKERARLEAKAKKKEARQAKKDEKREERIKKLTPPEVDYSNMPQETELQPD